MKIYTRTGDEGSTGLFGGPRVSKDDIRIEAYGTVDELNATIGLARACGQVDETIDCELEQIQSELFSIGAELATPDPDEHDLRIIAQQHIDRLERWIDQHDQSLEPLKQFVLPGGSVLASNLHLARAVCRRAERRVVALAGSLESTNTSGQVSVSVIVYLNRLSDYLFVASRSANQRLGIAEQKWVKP